MIAEKTTHCAPFLQKLLTGEGQDKLGEHEHMLSHITSVMLELIDKEHKYFDSITRNIDEFGRGFVNVEPGTVIHSAVCLGSHQYMLHYDFVAKDKKVKLAYISQKTFQEAVEHVNDAAIEQVGDYLLGQSGFNKSSLSKQGMKKVIRRSKLVNLPKGWRYSNQEPTNRLYLILRGSMRYDYGTPSGPIEGSASKKVNLRNFLAGGFKPVSIQDRINIEKDRTRQTNNSRLGKKKCQNELTKQIIL